MGLVERVDQDTNQALRDGDQARLSTLRLLKNSLTAAAKTKGADLDDAEAVKIIGQEVKQRRDSVAGFKQGGRTELAAREEAEIQLLEQYLPAQLGEPELTELVKQAIKQVGAESAADMGKVMSAVMAKVAGRADGTRVAAEVRKQLQP